MGRIFAMALAIVLSGCQSAVQHNTASGRPEITVNASATELRPIILGELINQGYSIVQDTPYLLVMDRRSNNVMANVLLGSNFNPIVNARMSITFAEIDKRTRVVVDMALITNPGSGFEQPTPMTNSQFSKDVQTWLTGIAARYPERKPTA